MTVYKKYKYIYRALDSVLKQSYEDIELIICDDCSGDFPEDDIRWYVDKNKRENLKNILIYSNEENLGTVRNFNTAIKKATGFYFISLSADDIFYSENVMKEVVKKFNNTAAIYGTCRAIMETSDNRNGLCFQTEQDIRNLKEMDTRRLYNRVAKDNIILGACTYFTREALEQMGYFDEQYVYIEDIARFLKILREGKKIEFFDIAAIWHTMDGVSNSKEVPKRYLEDNLNICKNEILDFREELSFFSYRYNLCRKKSLEYRINNGGLLKARDKFKIVILYPDAAFYNVFVGIRRKLSKRRFFIQTASKS